MKNDAAPKILVLLLLAASLHAAACAVASSGQLPRGLPRDAAGATDPALAEVASYRGWSLVNPRPVKMDTVVAQMCAPLFPREAAANNPHADKFISVYVNDAGRRAMLGERAPRFPQGSLIVKEKLSDPASRAPELLTAMLKREAGYDPQHGDWEYLVLDGAASKILERGRLENCQGCHAARKADDYVFRIYLPAEVRRQLR